MTTLRNLFDINYELIIFGYGLVFFVLGLAITLQSRQRSRLHLARSLGWLAIFGITHGLHEWGLIFIPIQATYMNHAGVTMLQVFQVILLGFSFGALFQFGADLVQDKWPRLRLLPFVLTGAWFLWFLVMGLISDHGVGLWQRQASIWARYGLAFPGALLAAYGLRYQAEKQIKPLNLESIYNMLRVSGAALVFYAIFAGLFVPYSDFIPARWLNHTLLVSFGGIPVAVYRSLAGLLLTVTIIRAMEVFDVETDQLIERMELKQNLSAERERIGRELHDGAIQTVYTSGLILESARQLVGDESEIARQIDRAMQTLNEAIFSLRTYMTDLRESPQAPSLIEGLKDMAANTRLTALMEVDLQLDLPEGFALTPIQSAHTLAVVGEALANAARHGHANAVQIRATENDGDLVVRVIDDGAGFVLGEQDMGYGLRNMRDRARILGGDLVIDSKPQQGTEITLRIPLDSFLNDAY